VAVDGLGNLYVSGSFTGTVDFGGGPVTSQTSRSIFLASFDAATGAHRWSRSFGTSNSNLATGLGANASGRILMTGLFWYGIDFGGGLVSGAGDYGSAYAASFDGATGAHRWSTYVGKGYGNAAAVDAAGGGYVTGTIVTSVYVGGQIRDRDDIFILAHGT